MRRALLAAAALLTVVVGSIAWQPHRTTAPSGWAISGGLSTEVVESGVLRTLEGRWVVVARIDGRWARCATLSGRTGWWEVVVFDGYAYRPPGGRWLEDSQCSTEVIWETY
jgi:hypothetical protein